MRDVWRQGHTAILIQVPLLTIAVLPSNLGWGCSTVGHWRPALCKLVLILAFLSQLTDGSGHAVYILSQYPPPSSLLRLIYTGASLDWRLGRWSIYNTKPVGRIFLLFCNVLFCLYFWPYSDTFWVFLLSRISFDSTCVVKNICRCRFEIFSFCSVLVCFIFLNSFYSFFICPSVLIYHTGFVFLFGFFCKSPILLLTSLIS